MTPDTRNRQIRMIKAAGRTIFKGDEDAERDLYETITRKRRCSEMTDAELRQVGDYLARATGYQPERRVSFRSCSSADLAHRLDQIAAAPAPGTWRINPLRTTAFFRQHTGADLCPHAHLDSAQQSRLYRAAIAVWRRCGVDLPAGCDPRPTR